MRKKVVPRRISVRNHNRLLWNYDGALGGKTGYTHAAQKCFVGAVQRNGTTLIVAILGARDQWGDTKRLLEYGFDNYDMLKGAPAARRQGSRDASSKSASGVIVCQRSSCRHKRKSLAQTNRGVHITGGIFPRESSGGDLSRQINEKGIDAFVEKTANQVRAKPLIACG